MPGLVVLADHTRTRIVEILAERDCSVGELVERFPISQPAISRHLRLLREAGVVGVEPAGKQRVYRLNPAAIAEVASWAAGVCRTWESRFDALGKHLDRMAEEEKQ